MGVFGKFSLKGAKPTVKGVYFEPGEYVVEIVAMKMVDVRNEAQPMFVADFKVLESDNGTKEGASRNWAAKTKEDWAPGAIVGLLMAASGLEPDDADGLERDWDTELDDAVNKGTYNGKTVIVQAVSRLKGGKVKLEDKPENYRTYTNFYPAV